MFPPTLQSLERVGKVVGRCAAAFFREACHPTLVTFAVGDATRRERGPRYRTPCFAHIWGGGYAAGYYSYLWSDVLDDDAYQWFVEHGGMTRANGQRFRDMILSRGGSEDAAQMYPAFRGRDPSVEALLVERGLKPAGSEK